MLATISLRSLEPCDTSGFAHRAHHAKSLGAGERTKAPAQIDRPRRAEIVRVRFRGNGARHDVEPLRVALQVIYPYEEIRRRTGRFEGGGDVHLVVTQLDCSAARLA